MSGNIIELLKIDPFETSNEIIDLGKDHKKGNTK